MKHYQVVMMLPFMSPIFKFESDSLEACQQMAKLLSAEDDEHDYRILEVIQ